MTSNIDAKAYAEARFKKRETQAREGTIATAEYHAEQRRIAEKTERLRALRLAREAAAKATDQASS